MSGYRILSRRPGFRRAGIAHPAVKDYAPGELTAAQLDAIRAEPNLTVVELADAGAVTTDGRYALTELRAAVGAAIVEGISLEAFTLAIVGFIAREWNTQGAPGTAREAPSADSGSDASASDGTQSAPPPTIPAPQQPAEVAGRMAEPEAENADQHGKEAAQASDSAASGQAASAPETGEATGSGGPAAAAPVADLSHQDTQPAADHAPGAPAEGAEGTAAPSANPPAAKPAKATRKAR